jgi:hypothetical protein
MGPAHQFCMLHLAFYGFKRTNTCRQLGLQAAVNDSPCQSYDGQLQKKSDPKFRTETMNKNTLGLETQCWHKFMIRHVQAL